MPEALLSLRVRLQRQVERQRKALAESEAQLKALEEKK